MARAGFERAVEVVEHLVVRRPATVVVAFLLLSGVFALGLGASATESGTEQFTEEVPAQAAFEDVNEKFEQRPFEPASGSTQLIQRESNVLSKPSILRMLRAQHRLAEHPEMRVTTTASVAQSVATTLDPSARTLAEQVDAVERASPTEVRRAARETLRQNPELRSLLSDDYNAQSVSASATIGTVRHGFGGSTGGAGQSGESPLQSVQQRAQTVVDSVGGNIVVFGGGIVSAEFANVIGDSLRLVVPASVAFILFFLVFAYRDPFDLLVGVVSLGMAILWTFGFMGLVGIPFTQMLVAVPPLLLAVGIDFGIHAVNRFREERVAGYDVDGSMARASDQLLVAFAIVTGTTVIGFAANTTSALAPIRDFGVVAAVGIVFTFLIFGIFLPAAKVLFERKREAWDLPSFGRSPLGAEGSVLGAVLPVGVGIGRLAPRLFLVVLLVGAGASAQYGTNLDSSFTQEDFLPPEETPAYLESLPEPLAPHEYTVTGTLNFLEDNFESGEDDQLTVYVEGPLRRDDALEAIHRAGDDPPDTFVTDGGHAESTSIVTVVRSHADRDPAFARLVRRNDQNANGIPDQNLERVYEALLASPAGDRARNYITEDYRSTRVVYQVKADAEQTEVTRDGRHVADQFRFEATATGSIVVFKAVSDVILRSALASMALALALTALFLVVAYWLFDGRPSLGVVNLVPILATVAFIAGTMRWFDVPLNALTGTILSIAIGLGIDYSAHLTHRFADEYDGGDLFPALEATVRGTGGALAGSMLTTVTGIGVLVFAITPVLGQFGLLIGMSILYSFLAAMVVLPPTLVVWARWRESFWANVA